MELTLDLDRRYTYADYLTWMDDVRTELIEGFIKLLPAPRTAHAETRYNIFGQSSKGIKASAKFLLHRLTFVCRKTARRPTIKSIRLYSRIFA